MNAFDAPCAPRNDLARQSLAARGGDIPGPQRIDPMAGRT